MTLFKARHMSGIKIWATGVFLGSAALAHAADRQDLSDIIATCAGRMSAELEFSWLLSDPETEAFETQRNRFVDILEALGPSPHSHGQLATLLDARAAHSNLLMTAYLDVDKSRAAWAKRHATKLRSACQNMLLHS